MRGIWFMAGLGFAVNGGLSCNNRLRMLLAWNVQRGMSLDLACVQRGACNVKPRVR